MSFAVPNVFAPVPRPAPERTERPRDEREFARALEEEEDDVGEPREAERADESKVETKSEPAIDPALLVAAAAPTASPLAMVPAAAANLAAILAPSQASSPVAADVPVEPAPEIAPQVAGEAIAERQPKAEPAATGTDRLAAALAAASTLAGAAAQTELDATQNQGEARPSDVEADLASEGDAVWTPPGPPKPPGAAMKTAAQTAMTQAAMTQAASAQSEQLAPVRVLRQAAVEAPAPEAKAAPGQAAPAGASPAGPIVVSPGASFEAKLQLADAAGSTPSAPQARPAAAPPPAAQVAVHIARTFEEGVRRLEIKLSPAELGRVEVKLEVGHDGRVQAVVAADRQDTLDLLQRDARTLERALQDAGIRADSGSLSFTLRQQDRQAWSGSGHDGSRPGDGGQGSASQADGLVSARPRPNLRALDISV